MGSYGLYFYSKSNIISKVIIFRSGSEGFLIIKIRILLYKSALLIPITLSLLIIVPSYNNVYASRRIRAKS